MLIYLARPRSSSHPEIYDKVLIAAQIRQNSFRMHGDSHTHTHTLCLSLPSQNVYVPA